MGVISVGASLGVKDDARAVTTTTSAAPPPLHARMRRAPVMTHAPPPGAGRKQPLRKRPPTTSTTTYSSSTISSSSNAATSSAATTTAQEEDTGAWQVTRAVSVATRLEPQLLLPHVIGSRGARINAIMSQSKCVITDRRRDSLASGASASGFYSVNFQVSAESLRRVEHGAKLLRAAVENAEQIERARAGSALQCDASSSASNGSSRPRVGGSVTTTGDVRTTESASKDADSAVSRKRTLSEVQVSEGSNDSGAKRIRHPAATAASARDALEIDEFRIRLQRSAALARKAAQDAARAQAQEAKEKRKYAALLLSADALRHKRRVSDLVVTTQCAVLAGTEAGMSAKRKRTTIEKLSFAHDACWSGSGLRHVIAPDTRIPRLLKTRPAPPMLLSERSVKALAVDGDLGDLLKKVEAFKMATSAMAKLTRSSAPADPEPSIDDADARQSNETDALGSSATATAFAAPAPPRPSDAPDDCKDASSSENRRESFRSTWDAPGANRDLNLVQDYSGESDCKLLQLVVGERQYFYLEPLLLTHSAENHEALKRWILTDRDVKQVCSFLVENEQYGKQFAASISAELGAEPASVFQSSVTAEWSAVQRQFAQLHSLALAAHLLGYHSHAVQTVRDGARVARELSALEPTHDVLTEETLRSDLFKFILRPIRSSAIESSLLDSLPISLVRETVEHCPEVLNHVLHWREEEDVPVAIAQDIKAANTAGGSSAYLRGVKETMVELAAELDGVLSSLGARARRVLSASSSSSSSLESARDRDSMVFFTNQLKDVAAKLAVETVKLQLHKWATVFLQASCSWFDSDVEDAGYSSDSDRNYDKFTCLQDALFVWHNRKVLYSSKDDLEAAPLRAEPTSKVASSTPKAKANECAEATPEPGDAPPRPSSQDGRESVENEVKLLKSVTPAAMLDEVENRFTAEDVAKHLLASQELWDARVALTQSLATMKTLMEAVGRSAPWRAHVKHSNELKLELAKQAAIEEKLIRSQWAFYYLRHRDQLPRLPAEPKPERHGVDASTQREAADAIDWTGVFDARDAADVVEMKKLRHELAVANARVRTSAIQEPTSAERSALADECDALARTCAAALTKFLGESVDEREAAQIRASVESSGTPLRRRARSRSVVAPPDEPSAAMGAGGGRKVRTTRPGYRRRSESETTAASSPVDSDALPMDVDAARRNPKTRAAAKQRGCSGCGDAHCACVACDCCACGAARLAAVHKTLAMLVSCVEANEGCKWVLATSATQFASGICGLLRGCARCQYCDAHCTCGLPTATAAGASSSSSNAPAAAGRGLRARPTATRKQRRFLAKPAAAPRRAPASSDGSANDQEPPEPPSRRTRRSTAASGGDENASAAPEGGGDAAASTAAPQPAASETPRPPDDAQPRRDWDKHEQEDLFRAARVRMKLQRSTFAKLQSLYGALPANALLDGEMLWQPERIRMMWERKDFFGVLGAPRDATAQQIKRQYRKLALKLHPDKTPDVNGGGGGQEGDYYSSTADERVEAFVAVTHAYKLLSGDPSALSSNMWKPASL